MADIYHTKQKKSMDKSTAKTLVREIEKRFGLNLDPDEWRLETWPLMVIMNNKKNPYDYNVVICFCRLPVLTISKVNHYFTIRDETENKEITSSKDAEIATFEEITGEEMDELFELINCAVLKYAIANWEGVRRLKNPTLF